MFKPFYYLRLASGEGIVSLGVRLSRCHAVCVRRISLDGEGNALYSMLSSYYFSLRSYDLIIIMTTTTTRALDTAHYLRRRG